MKLVDLKVCDFLDELASSSPAPGGGSVSALAGANGCSLILMVSNLTIGKKKFKTLDLKIQNAYLSSIEIFQRNKIEFTDLIDLDTDAFNKLMEAYQLPKETDDEIIKRTKEIDKATLGCIKVPLKVAALGLESLREIENIIEYSNKNTISDQGVSILMLYSAIEGAAMNVLINLLNINDEELKKEFKHSINDILLETDDLKEKLLEEIKYLLK